MDIGMSCELTSMGESVGIPLDEAWLVSLEQELAETNWEPWRTDHASIFRVPHHIRDDNAELYDPKVVSLGPYHRDVDRLLSMNCFKRHYLKKFLGRSPSYALVDYVRLIQAFEHRARAAYADDLSSMTSNDFVMMMLLDGCFVVETVLLLKYGVSGLEAVQNPMASSSSIPPVVARDMLMLENQLPFFLLQSLFDKGCAFPRQLDFAEYAVEFFAEFVDMELKLPHDDSGNSAFCHLLHLFHSCINPRKDAGEVSRLNISSRPNKSRTTRVMPIPTATRLIEEGVKIKRKLTSDMLDITFHNGKMEIPQLVVNDQINTLFWNLIAFEQGYKCASRHLTSYVSLMDCIIDTPADVTLLQKCGIIVNGLGDNENVTALFNNLCARAAIDDGSGYLASVFEEVNRHCNSKWNHYKMKLNQFLSILRRDYFGKPWSVIRLIAGILVFCLTLTLAVLTYVRAHRIFSTSRGREIVFPRPISPQQKKVIEGIILNI